MTPLDLRRLAHHLGTRLYAASLDGYDLVDGLLAAADLLDGLSGPIVHADPARASDAFPQHVPLRDLAARFTRATDSAHDNASAEKGK